MNKQYTAKFKATVALETIKKDTYKKIGQLQAKIDFLSHVLKNA